jgi:glycolate oxidase iron-sulfur subunit
VLGEEMDSPRGRIFLMKSALEGALAVEDTLPYVDRCLGCLACVPACPSGVPYGELLPLYRAHAGGRRRRGLVDQAAHVLAHETLPYPGRFRLAALSGPAGKLVQGALPGPWRAMLDLLPDSLPPARPLPEIYPAEGPRRARVALLAGCVQQALAPEINWATLRVLATNGVEVIIPRGQGCCGSLALHAGEVQRARHLARADLRAFPSDVDAVITNAAGCGSGMKEYGVLFAGQPEAAEAAAFARRVRDVGEFLDGLGLSKTPLPLPEPLKVAYHDACHLAHAQGVAAAPRRLLASIPNLTLVEAPEGEMCCGSAGTYNVTEPAMARRLLARKVGHLEATRAEAVVTANPGCILQIQAGLRARGLDLPVLHLVEILDRSSGGPAPDAGGAVTGGRER